MKKLYIKLFLDKYMSNILSVFIFFILILNSSCLFNSSGSDTIVGPKVFFDETNWHILRTDSVLKSYTQTLFAGGIVGYNFDFVKVSSKGILLGKAQDSLSSTIGFSYIPIEFVSNPIGNIKNYLTTSSSGSWNYVIGCYVSSNDEIYVLINENPNEYSATNTRTSVVKASTKQIISSAPLYGGISSDIYHRMAVDSNGFIWMSARESKTSKSIIAKLNPINGSYQTILVYYVKSPSDNEYFTSAKYFQTAEKEVWIIGNNYIYYVDKNGSFTEINPADTPFLKKENPNDGFFVHNNITYAYSMNNDNTFDIYRVNGTSFSFITSFGGSSDLIPSNGFSYNGLYYFPSGKVFDPSNGTVDDSSFPVQGGVWYPKGIYSSYDTTIVQAVSSYTLIDTPVNIFRNEALFQLTPTNTSDGLLQNNIIGSYIRSNGDLYISYPTYGYSIIDRNLKITTRVITGCGFDFHEYQNRLFMVTDRGLYDITDSSQLILPFNQLSLLINSSYLDRGYIKFANDTLFVSLSTSMFSSQSPIPTAKINIITKEIESDSIWTMERKEGSSIIDYAFDKSRNRILMVYKDSHLDNKQNLLSYSFDNKLLSEIIKPDDYSETHNYSIFELDNEIYLYDFMGGYGDGVLYKYENDNWLPIIKVKRWWTNGRTIDGIKIDSYLILYGGADGFLVIDESKKRYAHLNSKNSPIPSDRVNTIQIQNLNDLTYRVWFGTDNGLCYMQSNIKEWDNWN